MATCTSHQSYPDFVAELKTRHTGEAALRNAVGGDFIATGIVEEQLLRSLGLRDGHVVIDVGCGSGRLAFQLTRYPRLQYIGTDVVAELVTYAERLCQRKDWVFDTVDVVRIPAADHVADFVVFFSVFTHLSHEDTFRYLREARRVLKPGGRIVFSFLEFRLPAHWDVFGQAVDARQPKTHLNQFFERDAIGAWAQRLGLVVETLADGDRPHIPLERDVRWPDGRVMSRLGNLGQSVAVLRMPEPGLRPPDTAAAAAPAPTVSAPAADGQRPAPRPASCISCRAHVAPGNGVLISGFTLGHRQLVCITVSGRRLLPFGIDGVLLQPNLGLYNSTGRLLADNRDWRDGSAAQRAAVTSALEELGRPSLDPAGGEAALLLALDPGVYSVVVSGAANDSGIVHLEIHFV